MDRLYAPWRESYIKDKSKNKGSSVFAKILKADNDKKHFIYIRTKHSFSVLNIYPYNNGHSLIIPKRQVKDLSDLKKDEREDLFDLLDETKEVISVVLNPHGFNIGINLGRIAGAGIPQHLHIHIVPRWRGDANYMPVVAQTRVVSQSLPKLYKELSSAYKRRHRKKRS